MCACVCVCACVHVHAYVRERTNLCLNKPHFHAGLMGNINEDISRSDTVYRINNITIFVL